MKVLITECGGPAAISIIKSFRDFDISIELCGIDCNQYAAGFKLCNEFFVCPKGCDESYIRFVQHMVATYKINLIVCAGEHDLYKLSENKDLLGCKLFISSPETIAICQNKLLFYEKCKEDFKLPRTFSGAIICKPITGSGSKGISIIDDTSILYQEYLPGKEYTVDVFCDEDSNMLVAVPRERLEIKSGISTKVKISFDSDLIEQSKKLCRYLRLVGASNIQFREDCTGCRKILEVNPRLAGGSAMSLLCGINFAESYMKIYSGVKQQHIFPTKDLVVVRYYEELYFD